MRCPFCTDLDTRVIDSRLVGEGDQIRRRRECNKCKERFTTYESAELTLPRIIKSDGRREPFNEEKLRGGIERATQKREVGIEQIDMAVATIIHNLRASGEREIESMRVGNWVMEQLRRIDQVAYVRFASVYRKFEDVRAFLEEIERVENELPPELQKSQLDLLNSEEGGDEN